MIPDQLCSRKALEKYPEEGGQLKDGVEIAKMMKIGRPNSAPICKTIKPSRVGSQLRFQQCSERAEQVYERNGETVLLELFMDFSINAAGKGSSNGPSRRIDGLRSRRRVRAILACYRPSFYCPCCIEYVSLSESFLR